VKALSGTGCDVVVEPELDAPPPPPEPLPPVDVERVVPLADVFALDETVSELLELAMTLEPIVAELAEFDNGDVEVTDVVALFVCALELRADVWDAAEETPFVADVVSKEPVDPLEPAPAPEDEPAVLEAVAATVPLVDACT
jgi:hypothetical protein